MRRPHGLDDSGILRHIFDNSEMTPSGCLEWQGHRSPLGYGKVFYKGRAWVVSNLVATLLGKLTPEAPTTLHECDNPPCCHPEHLTGGTQKDNILDRNRKGRNPRPKGSGHYASKFSPEDIKAIRESTLRVSELADKHGVSSSAIRRVRRGTTYNS